MSFLLLLYLEYEENYLLLQNQNVTVEFLNNQMGEGYLSKDEGSRQ